MQGVQALEIDRGGCEEPDRLPHAVISVRKNQCYAVLGFVLVLAIGFFAGYFVHDLQQPSQGGTSRCTPVSGEVQVSDDCAEPCIHVKGGGNVGLPGVELVLEGPLCSTTFRLNYEKQKKRISPWHDVPLSLRPDLEQKHSEKFARVNMIVEIPRGTKRKWGVQSHEPNNPIGQKVRNGRLVEYPGPFYWNYGILPRTFEDQTVNESGRKIGLDDAAMFAGDGDPLDIVEIGSKTRRVGEIVQVKVLGVIPLIDDGFLDWKVIGINVAEDPSDNMFKDIADVDNIKPGTVSGIVEWYRWINSSEGKALNVIGSKGRPFDKQKTKEVIRQNHEAWKKLCSEGGSKGSKDWWVPENCNPEQLEKQDEAVSV